MKAGEGEVWADCLLPGAIYRAIDRWVEQGAWDDDPRHAAPLDRPGEWTPWQGTATGNPGITLHSGLGTRAATGKSA